jgi:hypothetical protein
MTITVEVLAVTGQLVSSKYFVIPGSSSVRLDDFNAFKPGIYFLRISTGTSQQVIRAIKI